MNKVAILIFALAISHAYGQACETDLGTWLDVTVSLTAPTGTPLGTGLDTCKSKENYDGCCTSAQITGIKTDTTTLQGTLETDAGTRDTAILAARAAVGAQYANYTAWLAAATAADSVLTTWEGTQPTGVTAQQVTDIQTAITTISGLWTPFFTNYNTIRTGFDTYQTARATCITEMLKDQVSAKCLACLTDADYAANGVVSTAGSPNTYAIGYGDDLKERMAAACQPYFTASETQTNVFLIEPYAAGMEDMTAALVKIAAEDTDGVAEFITAATAAAETGTASTIPDACTTSTCAWITDTLFVNGVLDTDLLIQGGDAVTRRRMLQYRVLQGQANTFDPTTTEAVFTITFPDNPADVDNVNDLSALRVGVFSCIIAFFVALLI